MWRYTLDFEAPWLLGLLLLLPVVWLVGRRSVAALGRWRGLATLLLRTLVLALLVLALAQAQMVRTSERVTVLFLLDQSLSIPEGQRQAMIEYVNAAILEHRRRDDSSGVIVFGREPAIEIPPFDDDVQLASSIESLLDPEYTNLAAALKLAQASFPEDAAKRIVLVTDGNENLGDAREEGRGLAAAGIGIDVVPIRWEGRSEVIVERVTLPSQVRAGEPFDLRIVISNITDPSLPEGHEVPGRLVISRSVGDRSIVLSDERVVLPPGKRVFSLRQEVEAADFYTYEARFVPDRPEDDTMPQNNRATAFTHVRGRGQVLLVEDHASPGEHDHLVGRLRAQEIEVQVMPTSRLFSQLVELQPFDAVILANVPRERFSDAQVDMLVANTQQMGSGLVMLGGPNSFGAGGWAGTAVEEAMPVDFQIKAAKVVPVGALVLVIDRSGSMAGQKIELGKAAAVASVQMLGPRDFVGVVAFDGAAEWTVPMRQADSFEAIAGRIGRLAAGGGTNLRPGMELGHRGLLGVDASVKHMLVLSDGHTIGERYEQLAARIARDNITISTVGVGPDADMALMDRIAHAGGGQFYEVHDPRALPQIFVRETRRVARPLIHDKPVVPLILYPHEMIAGVSAPLPRLDGFVLTERKEHPLIEVAMISPEPADERHATLLATWTYGLGRTVAFTSDAGARWAAAWTAWEQFDRLFGQTIRWAMRPAGDEGQFSVSTDVEGGEVRVVVHALDQDDALLSFLDLTGRAVGPDLSAVDLRMVQTAPGRYTGSFPIGEAGAYFLMLSPGAGRAPILSGVNIPYSDEFRDRSSNEPLLKELAATEPAGGAAGLYIDPPTGLADLGALLEHDPYRRDLPRATASGDIWHLLLWTAGLVFFADIFVRRVQVHFAWAPTLAARLLGRRRAAEAVTIARLRSRKAEIVRQLDETRRSIRFEPAGRPSDAQVLEEAAAPSRPPSPPPDPPAAPQTPAASEGGYTQRLLKAKQRVWEERNTP